MIYTKKITNLNQIPFLGFFSGFLELNANLIQEKKGPNECILSIFFRCIMIRVSGLWAMMKKLEHFFLTSHYHGDKGYTTIQLPGQINTGINNQVQPRPHPPDNFSHLENMLAVHIPKIANETNKLRNQQPILSCENSTTPLG